MQSPDPRSEPPHAGADAPTSRTVELDREIIKRWRRRKAERRHARLLRPHNRRALAERVRRTANDATCRDPARRGLDASVDDRAAAVRTKLLEIADLLECAYDPDPASVDEISQLLAKRGSPLYHPGIHISELYAALYYVRAGLITQVSVKRAALPAGRRTTAAKRRLGVLHRWRERRTERRHRRLVSARNRRNLARWLRLTATHATDRDPVRRRHDVLLHYRAAAVRTDLLEIAALLERSHDPDPDRVAALRNLLANGCDSPLYNADIDFSELRATLDYVRSGL